MLVSGTQAHYIFPSSPGCILILMFQVGTSTIMTVVQESEQINKGGKEISKPKHQLMFNYTWNFMTQKIMMVWSLT